MEVVELYQCQGDEGEQDEVALVAVELVFMVDYCAYEQLDSNLGDEEGVRGEDTADAAECETTEEADAGGGVARE